VSQPHVQAEGKQPTRQLCEDYNIMNARDNNRAAWNEATAILYIMVQLMRLSKTLIQMSHTKTFKITPICFDHHQGAF
jgi:hypothetical protein